MRIDKLISDVGIASRKECAKAARSGGILVDGIPEKNTARHIDPEKNTVTYLGRVIEYKRFVYILLNKPEGYVSATEDTAHPYVTELLPEELRRRGLFPVGRLDKDTVGVMILTDDGKLAHTVLSPKKHVSKIYRFHLAEPLRVGAEEYFREGVTLADGYECKSAGLLMDESRLSGEIILTEGKYHQIKRMMGAMGNKVTYLERISFASLPQGNLPERGGWRYLTPEEERELRAAAE